MTENIICERYAKALILIAQEKNLLKVFEDELDGIVSVFKSVPVLKKLFLAPDVNSSQKKEIISKVFSNNINIELLNFMYVLINKKREQFLEGIAEGYKHLKNRLLKFGEVKVITAENLDIETQRALGKQLELVYKSNLILNFEVDPAIVGGVIINDNIGVYDCSYKKAFTQIEDGLKDILMKNLKMN